MDFCRWGRFKSEMKKLLSDASKKIKFFYSSTKLETIPSWVAKADFLYLSLNDSKLSTNCAC